MSQKNYSMDDDDIAFAIGRLILNRGSLSSSDLQEIVKTGMEMRSYSGVHNRLFCVCDVAFSRGYFFLEERKQVRDLLNEMDALPDQSDFRVNAPRVPSSTRGMDAVIPEAKIEELIPVDVPQESFPPVVFSREST